MTSERKENLSGVRPPQWKRIIRILWCRVSLCGSVEKKNTHTSHVSFYIWVFKQMLINTLKRSILNDKSVVCSGCWGMFNEGLWLYGYDFLLSHMPPLVMIKGRGWRRTWMSPNYMERDSPIILCILVKNRHLYSFHTGHYMPQHCLQYIYHICGLRPQQKGGILLLLV